MYTLTGFDIYMHPWNRHHNHDTEHIRHPKSFLVTLCKSSLSLMPSPPCPQAPLICFSMTIDKFLFSGLLYKWNYAVCTVFVWLLLLSMLILRLLYVVEHVDNLSLFHPG